MRTYRPIGRIRIHTHKSGCRIPYGIGNRLFYGFVITRSSKATEHAWVRSPTMPCI